MGDGFGAEIRFTDSDMGGLPRSLRLTEKKVRHEQVGNRYVFQLIWTPTCFVCSSVARPVLVAHSDIAPGVFRLYPWTCSICVP